MTTRRPNAFTLIELLIVVAIIAILAAIAVPNFLEAQTRAKISRVKADLQALSTALEVYFIDYNNYPNPDLLYGTTNYFTRNFVEFLPVLTTPISYISSVMLLDPFTPQVEELGTSNAQGMWGDTFQYLHDGMAGTDMAFASMPRRSGPHKAYIMFSHGPSRQRSYLRYYPVKYDYPEREAESSDMLYDPTNGTKSRGGIARTGGWPFGPSLGG